jgi:hypothetical protein
MGTGVLQEEVAPRNGPVNVSVVNPAFFRAAVRQHGGDVLVKEVKQSVVDVLPLHTQLVYLVPQWRSVRA